jgi:hypothetical protein
MITFATAIAGALTLTSVTALTSSPAMARDSVALRIDLGNVRFGYSDGYYDHHGYWHAWGPGERRAYRMAYRDRYWERPRRYYPNRGWRDNDRDGVPNRYDRDRDGDGVPNRFDARPNNPYRD